MLQTGPIDHSLHFIIHKFMEVRMRLGMPYQKPPHWLKKLANTHVSFTVEKQSKAQLFQQHTDKHCCSFHPLSGHALLQQPSSCKTGLHSQPRWVRERAAQTDCSYTNTGNNIGRCHQNIIKAPFITTILLKVEGKKKRGIINIFVISVF